MADGTRIYSDLVACESFRSGRKKIGYQGLPGVTSGYLGATEAEKFFWLPWVTVGYRELPYGYRRVTVRLPPGGETRC